MSTPKLLPLPLFCHVIVASDMPHTLCSLPNHPMMQCTDCVFLGSFLAHLQRWRLIAFGKHIHCKWCQLKSYLFIDCRHFVFAFVLFNLKTCLAFPFYQGLADMVSIGGSCSYRNLIEFMAHTGNWNRVLGAKQ